MTKVVFYEKPGCSNNARQKQLLAAAGHELDVRNLLTEAWTEDLLLGFFAGKPVPAWFNKAAPKIKSGEIQPDAVDAATALKMMLADPILIRRPLMEAQGRRDIGFDPVQVESWIGLDPAHAKPADLESCRRHPAVSEGSEQAIHSAPSSGTPGAASEVNPS